jgi:hypothetical protein
MSHDPDVRIHRRTERRAKDSWLVTVGKHDVAYSYSSTGVVRGVVVARVTGNSDPGWHHGNDPVTVEGAMRTVVFAVVFLMLCGASGVESADHFVCDCSAGADGDCVAGSDGAAGTMGEPWQSYEAARIAFGSLAAGEAIRFCRGGAWTVAAGTRWVNDDCEAALPCVVGDYVPSWASGDEGRPVLTRTDGAHGFALEDGGTAEHEEGYRFENLDLRSTTGTGNGFFLYNDIDDVEIVNVAVDGFAIGVHLASSNPCSADPECDGRNDRLTIRGAIVTNNTSQGFLGGSDGTRILDSVFESNGSTAVFDHNIYISGASGHETDGIVVRGNRLYRSTPDGTGSCSAVSLVVHGEHRNLLIEGNEVLEDVGLAGAGCWGIAVDPGYSEPEGFVNVTIRGNRVSNTGNTLIGIAGCQNCVVENNVLIHGQPYSARGIAAPDRSLGPGDLEQDAIVIRNNSIWMGDGGGTAIRLEDLGDEHEVVSNVIAYPGTSASFNCFELGLPYADYTAVDHNICHAPNAPGAEWVHNGGSLATWQAASGFDGNSTAVDPGFADPAAGDLSASSATAAMIDAGHPTRSSITEIGGFNRGPDPDVGAHEWGVGTIFQDGFESGLTQAWSGSQGS